MSNPATTTRRRFLGTLTAVTAAAASLPAQTKAKTNLIVIMADDLGYECLGCYGGTSYKTPHLDRMAASGVRFTHAYAQPLCTPTRVQLMTGVYNFRNWKAFGILDPKETTFGHMFQKLGYKTAMAGKWQMWSYNPPDFEPEWRAKGMLAKDAGFDEYMVWHALHTEDKGSRYGDPTYMVNGKLVKDDKGKYGDDLSAEFLMSFMEKHRNEPFFCYFPMALTHGPFTATPRSKTWNSARLKSDRANFADMVEYMDDIMGRILAKVESLGIADRTLVLFYSDNGTDRGIRSQMGDKTIQGGKGLPTDAGTRVPLIASWKGRAAAGKVCDDLVDSTDFIPTMFEAAGAPLPKGMDGRSFLPQVVGKPGKPREWTYCWHDPRPGHGKEAYTKLVEYARTKQYKLYSEGQLYDVPADVLEQRPIPPGQGSKAAEAARKKLQGVLDAMHRAAGKS